MTVYPATAARSLPAVAWHISTKSDGGSGNCVEAGPVLDDSGRVAVRHSRRPAGDVLLYDSVEWMAFVNSIKADTFSTT